MTGIVVFTMGADSSSTTSPPAWTATKVPVAAAVTPRLTMVFRSGYSNAEPANRFGLVAPAATLTSFWIVGMGSVPRCELAGLLVAPDALHAFPALAAP